MRGGGRVDGRRRVKEGGMRVGRGKESEREEGEEGGTVGGERRERGREGVVG